MDKRKLSELLVEHKEKAIGDHAFTPREILAQAGDMARQKEIHVITGVPAFRQVHPDAPDRPLPDPGGKCPPRKYPLSQF